MSKVSIIIPVYNGEKYIKECLDSILDQSYKDFELLLIDDGSKDNSNTLLKEYGKNDTRINVVTKENGGVSSARNLGLTLAKGEWIAFVDIDDKLDKDYLFNLMKHTTDSDVVIGGFKCFGAEFIVNSFNTGGG